MTDKEASKQRLSRLKRLWGDLHAQKRISVEYQNWPEYFEAKDDLEGLWGKIKELEIQLGYRRIARPKKITNAWGA